MKVLAVYATAQEGAELQARFAPCLELGAGKAASAVSLCVALARGPRPDAALLFGVCGAFPARHLAAGAALDVLDLCVVGEDLLADEGAEVEGGFQSLAEMGLGEIGPFAADPVLAARAAAILGGVRVVRGATVSRCSGTEALSAEIARRSNALVETMEGAAVALACRALGVPLVHVRCVSNQTGERGRAVWRLADAAERARRAATEVLGRLA
ncbi:MAG: futalosine hydrolase [Planctomycetes bacterium]|nr:futalosine hydrolase [Planctomycetota bacterium]